MILFIMKITHIIFSIAVLILCGDHDISAERRPIFTVHAKLEKQPTNTPFNVNYKIQGDALIVSWEYRRLKSKVGFYIEIQEAATSDENFPINYVKVQEGSSSVEIRGLKPKALYNLKVHRLTVININLVEFIGYSI